MLIGGEYFGIGVMDNGNGEIFDFDLVIVGIGIIIVIYIYMDGNGCINSNIVMIMVYGVDYGDFQDLLYVIIVVSNGVGYCVVDVFQIYIGSVVDIEMDGQLIVNVDGDGVDEDGFNFGSIIFELGEIMDFIVDVFNNIGFDVELYVWFDWNNDGMFDNVIECYQFVSIIVVGFIIMGSMFGFNGNV